MHKASPVELRTSIEMAQALLKLESGLCQYQQKQTKNFIR